MPATSSRSRSTAGRFTAGPTRGARAGIRGHPLGSRTARCLGLPASGARGSSAAGLQAAGSRSSRRRYRLLLLVPLPDVLLLLLLLGRLLPIPPEPEAQFLGVVRQVSLSLRQQAATVEDREGKLEPNPWLRRVGWAVHLAGQDIGRIRRTVSLTVTEGWPPYNRRRGGARQAASRGREKPGQPGPGSGNKGFPPAAGGGSKGAPAPPPSRSILMLQLAWESVSRTILAAQALCASDSAGSAVLFEVNRKAVNVKPPRPFDARLEARTIERYINLWKRVVAYLFRISCWEGGRGGRGREGEGQAASAGFVRPPFRLTAGQQAAFLAFRTALLAERLGPLPPCRAAAAADREAGQKAAIDRACLDFLVALLDHPLPGFVVRKRPPVCPRGSWHPGRRQLGLPGRLYRPLLGDHQGCPDACSPAGIPRGGRYR